MYHDNPSTNAELIALSPQTLYRGLYVRVAKRLGVDPSYVSRVARRERQSPEVESALSQEIERIGKTLGSPRAKASTKRTRPKSLKFFVGQKQRALEHDWLHYIHADPNLSRIKLSSRQRIEPVTPVVNEMLKSMDLGLKEISSKPMRAANKHGKKRRVQGYSPTTLLEEYNLIRRCVYEIAQQNLKLLEAGDLVHDLGQLGEVLDFQSQSAIRGFLAQA